jgi:hypothetical protein
VLSGVAPTKKTNRLPSTDVYWAGSTTGSVDSATPNFGGKDAWAAKFDVNGNKVFAFNHGTDKDDEGTAKEQPSP